MIVTAAAVVFVTFSLAGPSHQLPGSSEGWAATAGIGLATVVGIALLLRGLPHLRPVATAVVSAVEPVVSVLLSVALLGERMGLTQSIGLGPRDRASVLVACRSGIPTGPSCIPDMSRMREIVLDTVRPASEIWWSAAAGDGSAWGGRNCAGFRHGAGSS